MCARTYIWSARGQMVAEWTEGVSVRTFIYALAPHEPISCYRHNRTGEDNGDTHLKRPVMGRLDFGPL